MNPPQKKEKLRSAGYPGPGDLLHARIKVFSFFSDLPYGETKSYTALYLKTVFTFLGTDLKTLFFADLP